MYLSRFCTNRVTAAPVSQEAIDKHICGLRDQTHALMRYALTRTGASYRARLSFVLDHTHVSHVGLIY